MKQTFEVSISGEDRLILLQAFLQWQNKDIDPRIWKRGWSALGLDKMQEAAKANKGLVPPDMITAPEELTTLTIENVEMVQKACRESFGLVNGSNRLLLMDVFERFSVLTEEVSKPPPEAPKV